jgi:hypothetical protein
MLDLYCSHQVPNSSLVSPKFFALSSPLENLYIEPEGGDYNISILGLYNKARFFNFKIVMVKSNMPILFSFF